MKISPRDYKLLFRVANYKSTCLVSEFLVYGSLKLADPLIVNADGLWFFYLRNSKLKLLEQSGLNLFSSKNKFDKYSTEFIKYIVDTKEHMLKKYDNSLEKITKREFEKLLRHLKKFWYYYGFTEYVYHDYAYKYAIKNEDATALHNLEQLGDLKGEGRKIWDSYVPSGGLILNILTYFSEKYLYKADNAKYLFISELINLFDKDIPSKKLIHQRKKSYVVYAYNGKIYYPSYSKSLIISNQFSKYEEKVASKQVNSVKGTIANQGKIIAKAVVTPMYNIEDAVKISKIMEKGSVIIAQSTNPDLTVLLNKAGGIVTDQGGLLSHAAIVSREMNIPCIVGTRDATKIFKTGDIVEVDAYNGIVTRVE